MAIYQLKKEMTLQANLEDVWQFISSPTNLKKITPIHMGFDILSKPNTDKMYEGMIIIYKVKPFPGFATKWVTEITHIKEFEYFVDEQRVGPYSMWHHQHWIKESSDGVVMNDIVTYRPPFGILGNIANSLIIKKQLELIFDYREKALLELFSNH